MTNVIKKKVSFPSTTAHNVRSGSPKYYQEFLNIVRYSSVALNILLVVS